MFKTYQKLIWSLIERGSWSRLERGQKSFVTQLFCPRVEFERIVEKFEDNEFRALFFPDTTNNALLPNPRFAGS